MRCFKAQQTSLIIGIIMVAFLAIPSFVTAADEWPPDEMEIVISHSTGSSQNAVTRALGKVWEEYLGTNFVYNNKRGASGRIGYDHFMGSDAILLSSNQASASIMFKQQDVDWDWEEDLYQFGLMAIDPGAIFVPADSQFDTMQEMIDYSKETKITFGVSYWASPDNLLIHQIMEKTGARFEVIPYGSSRELMTSLLGGHISAAYTKVARIDRNADQTKYLALSMPENTIPEMTNNCPTINEVVGEKTLQVASFRAMVVKRDWKEKYPERYKKLKETFEKAKDDERFIEAVGKIGVQPGLIPDYDYEDIMDIVHGYWDAFDKLGHIYDQK